MTNVRSPVQISIPEKLTEEMEALFEEYQTLEPLLVQDRIHNRSDNPTEMGKQSTTEMDEDEDFDPSYHQSASSPNEYSIENNETVFDPITGRHRRPIGRFLSKLLFFRGFLHRKFEFFLFFFNSSMNLIIYFLVNQLFFKF